jgi:hypothetical protein
MFFIINNLFQDFLTKAFCFEAFLQEIWRNLKNWLWKIKLFHVYVTSPTPHLHLGDTLQCGSSDKYFLDRIYPQGVKIDIFYKGTKWYIVWNEISYISQNKSTRLKDIGMYRVNVLPRNTQNPGSRPQTGQISPTLETPKREICNKGTCKSTRRLLWRK